MSETMKLCIVLFQVIPIAALFATGWIAYRLRSLAAIESCLASLQSQIAALQPMAEQQSCAEEGHTRATVETERRKTEAAEWEIAAAASSTNRDFRAYPTELAAALAANGIRVDALTDEVLLRSFFDQFGRSRSN